MLNKIVLLILVIMVASAGYSQVVSPIDSAQLNGKAFIKVDKEAFFPGGEQAWKTFLEKNLNPNVPVDNGSPVGIYTVVVQFVVDTTGNVSDIKALTNMGYGMEKEVIRLMKKADHWTPAMLNGKPVNAYRKQPVTFQVSADGFDIITSSPQSYILYTGIDNVLNVEVDKMKSEDLRLTISQGTVIMTSDGKYIAKVNKPGRAIIEIYGKRNKKIGAVSFEVRQPAK